MLDQIAAAFDRQDYRTAAKLLKEFLRESPQNPFGQFYRGRLYEVSGKLEAAEEIYRQLLRDVVNPKIAGQARQGIQRLETLAQTRQQTAIAKATADPKNTELGILVLEAISSDIRTTSAQSFAQIMKLDAYTARLQIPHRGWRLYRTGAIGELQHYGQQLRDAEIPAFWAPLKALQNLQVFQVQYFQSYQPNAIAVCQNEHDQLGSLSFDWAEVTQRVEGRLPIFEQVVDTDARQRTQRQRKEQTQDYAHICDLHLPKRRCILRLCDLNYHCHQGLRFQPLMTVRSGKPLIAFTGIIYSRFSTINSLSNLFGQSLRPLQKPRSSFLTCSSVLSLTFISLVKTLACGILRFISIVG
jgi:hypothetical protein